MNRRQSIITTIGLSLGGIPTLGAATKSAAETFVEISGRQTGKSTRMRHFVAKKLTEGERVCVHTWMPAHVENCLRHLAPGINRKLLTVTDKFNHVAKNSINVYDDWDQALTHSGKKVPFVPGGYYSTSLSHLRDPDPTKQDELFRQLMEECGGKFLNFTWTQKQMDDWAVGGYPHKLQNFGAVWLDSKVEGGYLPCENAIEHTLFD